MESDYYRPGVHVLCGCTAAGKTAVARCLAEKHDLALLSADSMQVYRGLDIGTDKIASSAAPRPEIGGIDLVDPDENFSAGLFLEHARAYWRDVRASGRGLLIAGGSGLYLTLLLKGLQSSPSVAQDRARWSDVYRREGLQGLREALGRLCPDRLADLADPENPRRVMRALEKSRLPEAPLQGTERAAPPPKPVVGLLRSPAALRRRIVKRVEQMFAAGLLDEVDALRRRFPEWSATARQAIGYAEARGVLEGSLTREEARERIVVRTARLAKKQRTWFRHQMQVDWVVAGDEEAVETLAARVWETFLSQGESAARVPCGLAGIQEDSNRGPDSSCASRYCQKFEGKYENGESVNENGDANG